MNAHTTSTNSTTANVELTFSEYMCSFIEFARKVILKLDSVALRCRYAIPSLNQEPILKLDSVPPALPPISRADPET
jgi:hypothetical protein